MAEVVHVEYKRTGKSTSSNTLGMREMQARAYEKRDSQYLLLKAPPASGKSRALMFLALHKLKATGLRKAIVAVPETSIGASFKNTDLRAHGFHWDWHVEDRNDLCRAGTDAGQGKIDAFLRFLASDSPNDDVLICTHATLRFACEKIALPDFDDCLLAIDEFHHVSVDADNRLGSLIDSVMRNTTAHIVAMTGSYFRGDATPILLPQDEARFDKVTYTYYEQLNGYQHLTSLGLGYHFYQGRYIDAVGEVLDPTQKTIVHIPNVNSMESTKDKYAEVDSILDAIGVVESEDSDTGIIRVRHPDGALLLVADLVTEGTRRMLAQAYLRRIERPEDMDIIVALGMAKEGFDWPFCEHVLTIGYRNSMTEIVQIIGRATRDAPGKTHAQFTNLIAEPNADDSDVANSVNSLLKAITVSLLMEQVLAPNVSFKPRSRMEADEKPGANTVVIEDGEVPISKACAKALESASQDDMMASLLNSKKGFQAVAETITDTGDANALRQVEMHNLIDQHYGSLPDSEKELIASTLTARMAVGCSGGLVDEKDLPPDAEFHEGSAPSSPQGDARVVDTTSTTAGAGSGDDATAPGSPAGHQFMKMGDKFINIDELNVDLISEINPFQGAYEILSKSLTAKVLKQVQDTVVQGRSKMTEEEAVALWPRIVEFKRETKREPDPRSDDHMEARYAQALSFLRQRKRERMAAQAQEDA